jgi:hypothetical protein
LLEGERALCGGRQSPSDIRARSAHQLPFAEGRPTKETFTSVEEFNGDLRRHLFHRALHLLGSVCQPVGVDVYSDPATPAVHVIAEFQVADRLLNLVPALSDTGI